MSEEAQNRVQSAVKSFVNEVDRSHLRSMERSMHLCAADCCGQPSSSIDEVYRCVEKCHESTLRAQRFVQSELERFQESLSRCILQCQDEVKDKVTPKTTEAQVEKYRTEFEACAITCCDKSIQKLPAISKRVLETLQSGRY